MCPFPRMPVRWQPPRQRAAKVKSFAARNGRIVIVLIIQIVSLEVRCAFPLFWIQKSERFLASAVRLFGDSCLHPDWMPGDVAARVAAVFVPTRTDITAATEIGR